MCGRAARRVASQRVRLTIQHWEPKVTRDVRILIAEDETLIRLDLKELLEQAGFEVCAEARDGLEAVELAREAEPDAGGPDVKRPRLDGIEAAPRILGERPIPGERPTAYGQDRP